MLPTSPRLIRALQVSIAVLGVLAGSGALLTTLFGDGLGQKIAAGSGLAALLFSAIWAKVPQTAASALYRVMYRNP